MTSGLIRVDTPPASILSGTEPPPLFERQSAVEGCGFTRWPLRILRLRAAPAAASTGTIAYQGRLADSAGAPLTGTYPMTFRLYATATGGTPLWSESWAGSNGVKVSDGLFNEGMARLQSGMVRVDLDPIFRETIEGAYLVHVTPYGDASLYVAEVGQDYFVVRAREGDPNAAFAWRLSAMRKGYAGIRLEEVK